MSTLRRISLFFAGMFLRLALFFGFTLLVMVVLFGDSKDIKQAVANTDTYNRITDVAIETGRKEASKNDTSIPFDDPEVQKIIRNSFDAKTVQSSAEQIIDGIYGWLEGKTTQPEFSINLSANKERLANGLADYAINRLSSLPACQTIPEERNIYKITCKPVFLDVKAQRQALYNAIMNDQAVLKDTNLTYADLNKNEAGQPAEQPSQKIPQYFTWFKRAPWILFIFAALLAVFIVFRNRTKRQGLRTVASVLVGTGIALAITPLVVRFVMSSFNKSIQNSLNGNQHSVSSIVNDISNQIYSEFNTLLINIAIQVVLLGILLMITLKMTKPTAPYKDVKKKSGLSSSVSKVHLGKGVNQDSVPIQSSERKTKKRKPGSVGKNNKYRKVGL